MDVDIKIRFNEIREMEEIRFSEKWMRMEEIREMMVREWRDEKLLSNRIEMWVLH